MWQVIIAGVLLAGLLLLVILSEERKGDPRRPGYISSRRSWRQTCQEIDRRSHPNWSRRHHRTYRGF